MLLQVEPQHKLGGDNLQAGVQIFQARQAEKAKAIATAGMEALTKAAAEAGAVKTESGLVYRELVAGEGDTPSADDKVRVHYEGTLVDGTVFDSSIARGMPLEFELSRVIKGWSEGLQMMKVGGKAQLTIPADLGYGQTGTGPIPPEATLIFEVELMAITTDEW
eukprot:6225147-Prymnesium_polylepis.1